MGQPKRTHTCGELRAENEGKRVRLMGWVHRHRDQGGLVFFDLRDRYGLTQVTLNAETVESDVMSRAHSLRSEFVVAIEGMVQLRPGETKNISMPTGEIEVFADGLEILNESEVLPFVLDGHTDASEDLRLEYRFLDLRTPELQAVLALRHRICQAARRFLDSRLFLEIETPLLVRPTPEGARDFLVPSRIHPGSFYALPQSPQLYKQMLMVSGFDRYFQIAKCLRDEDMRADRQPEFSQIDIEMSFVDEEDIYELCEGMMAAIVRDATGEELDIPIPRLTYHDAMNRFGSDKPDVRFPLEIVDLSEAVEGSEFKVFAGALEAGGAVKALCVPSEHGLSRREIDELEALAKKNGAKGIARTKVGEDALEGGIAKFLSADEQARIIAATGGTAGANLLIIAGRWSLVCKSLGAVRLELGKRFFTLDPDELRFLWVTDFTLVEEDPDTGQIVPSHHIFTMPKPEDLPLLDSDPLRVHGQLYDLVLNGVELGSGSVRVHIRKLQEKILGLIGIGAEEADRRFGFLLRALEYGAPPHGGIALGLERIVMLLAGRSAIRDTIAFPKTTRAASLMDGSPAPVAENDLKGLHLEMRKETHD